MTKTALIISTYNWPAALRLCLKSVRYQKQLPDEIIIADDGSDERTKFVIEAFRKNIIVPVKHVWHEDKGFRLAVIRNKAIAAAECEYIVQADGDMILHPYFIEDHVNFAEKNSFVRASRIYLDEKLSNKMLSQQNIAVNFLDKGVSNSTSAIRIPVAWPFFETTYKNKGHERYVIHGSNMAFWKKDAILVNGYNELFHGWGPEDSEFVARLLNTGLKKKFLKLGGIAYHIFHEKKSKNRLIFNEGLLKQAIKSNSTFCLLGINQYLNNDGIYFRPNLSEISLKK